MMSRRSASWILVTLAACATPGQPTARTGAGRPVTAREDMGSALARYGELDRALGAYAAASDAQIADWKRASDRLGQWLRPVWERRVAARVVDHGAVEPVEAAGSAAAERALAAGDGATPADSSCTGACCVPSARPPPPPPTWIRRRGHKVSVLRLDAITIQGLTPRPNILWTATRPRADVAQLGNELVSAVGAGDDRRAAPLAGLLLAELAVRQREAAFARTGAHDVRPFDCGEATALLEELSASAEVGARARALRGVCLDLAGRWPEARPLLADAAGGRGDDDLAWRDALALQESSGALAALGAVGRSTSATSSSRRRAALLFASDQELQLSRYPAALASLRGAESVGDGDPAMTDLAARLAAFAVVEWELEVRDGTWTGGAGADATAACGAEEVLETQLRGSPLLRPALLRYADLAFDITSYPRAIVAYRAFVAQDPTSPEVVHALECVYESQVRNVSFDEARAEAGAIAAALADGSPWQRANAGDPQLIARARALVERVAAPGQPADRRDSGAYGELDPREALRALTARRGILGACLWGSHDTAHQTTVRLAVVIGMDGRLVEATATTPSRSAAVERCVADRSRTIQFPAPSVGPVSFDVWLVAR